MSDLSSFPSIDTLNGRFVESQLVYVTAKLGLADVAWSTPRSIEELAISVDVNPDALKRMMYWLVLIGVFEQKEHATYQLAEQHAVLRSDHPQSIRSYVIVSGEVYYRAFAELLFSVKTGKTGSEAAFGMSFFAYLNEHPDTFEHFNIHMGRRMKQDAEAAFLVYDFASYHHVADIGGGNGTFLSLLLQQYPEMQATLFDLSTAGSQARAYLQQRGMSDRCEVVCGDFFTDELPGSADLYLLSCIIHDWDDEHALLILKNCRRAMSSGSTLVLIEFVIQEQERTTREVGEDLSMLVVTGGRERTAEQFRTLLAKADLQLSRIIPTQGRRSVIEAIPLPPNSEKA